MNLLQNFLMVATVIVLVGAIVVPRKMNAMDCSKAYLCCVRARNNCSRFVSEYVDMLRELKAQIPLEAGINPTAGRVILQKVLPGIFGGRTSLRVGLGQGELLDLFLQAEARLATTTAANLQLKLVAGSTALVSIGSLVAELTDSELDVLETHTRLIADVLRSTATYDCADCIHERTLRQVSSRKYFHGKQIRTLGPPGL